MEEKSKYENNSNKSFNNNSNNLINVVKNTIFYSNTDKSCTKIVKKALIEFDLQKKFSIQSNEILYKKTYFYEKVKVILEPNRIIVYKLNNDTEGKNKLLFVLDFNQLTMEIAVNKRQKKFRILILGSVKDFRFKTNNLKLFEEFLVYLNYFISNSEGKKENLIKI